MGVNAVLALSNAKSMLNGEAMVLRSTEGMLDAFGETTKNVNSSQDMRCSLAVAH